MDDFIKDNKPLVTSILNSYKYGKFSNDSSIEWDNIEQAGLIALWNTHKGYNHNKGDFKNYAITAIKRAILRAITKELRRRKYSDIDNFYSIEDDKNNIDVIEIGIDSKELLRKSFKIIDSMETSLNTKKILKYYMLGYNTVEISKIMSCTFQNVSSTVCRHKGYIYNRIGV